MTPVEFLDLHDAVEKIRALGNGPVREIGLLDSAMPRPRFGALGEDASPTIPLKAAARFIH
jgi:death-on-curing protein